MALVVLLGLVAAEAVYPGVAVTQGRVIMLVGITGALLGVDMMAERLPVEVRLGRPPDEGAAAPPKGGDER